MRATSWTVAAFVLVGWAGAVRAAEDFPIKLTASAKVTRGATTVTSALSIRVDRDMDEISRKGVTDALKFGGYGNFLPALRRLPVVGRIELDGREVSLRYVRAQRDAKGQRLILVADRPLFFLGDSAAKARAGYELTVVDITLDEGGAGTGTMAGAARVKPAPDGSVILDDFAVSPVQLTVHKE